MLWKIVILRVVLKLLGFKGNTSMILIFGMTWVVLISIERSSCWQVLKSYVTGTFLSARSHQYVIHMKRKYLRSRSPSIIKILTNLTLHINSLLTVAWDRVKESNFFHSNTKWTISCLRLKKCLFLILTLFNKNF